MNNKFNKTAGGVVRHAATVLAAAALAWPCASKAQDALYPQLFPLSAVTLEAGEFRDAQSLNVDVLLQYDVDRLLAPYLKEAGLTPKGELFPNWEGLDGHVGGHYLSALAIHCASTGDPRLKERMEYMLDELERCQKKNGDGYLGGVPGGTPLWKEVKAGNVDKVREYWVPWYNVHKMYAGLRDAWAYAGSERARKMFLKFCDWCVDLTAGLSDEQMERMCGVEFGGMDEVLADAYAITGQQKYMDTAKRFAHRWLLDSMSAHIDNLDNCHANTQVPKVVGYQRIAELSGDKTFDEAARFFWDTVVYDRSLALGGNSRREHFAAADDCLSYVEDREGPESCNTNNMLKLTEGLFRTRFSPRYADFYEKALFNHIRSTQHPEHGGYVYFTSARPGHYRVYSQPNSAMWCCVGTGMENHGKYGEFIYSHFGDSLHVNLYIPSTLTWKEKGVTIRQTTDFPASGKVVLEVSCDGEARFPLIVRHPGWSRKMNATINGRFAGESTFSSSYWNLGNTWKDGDRIELDMDMEVSLERLPNNPQYVAIMRGPILMGARVAGDTPGLVADDSRWGHIAHGELMSVFDTPVLLGTEWQLTQKLNKMQPVDGRPECFTTSCLPDGWVLEPFRKIHDSRYMMYWLRMTSDEYDAYQAERKAREDAILALDARTVDAVNTGEQQPEVDHAMRSRNSNSGNHKGEPWRDAREGGFFSYQLATDGHEDLHLMVRYWGNEQGNRDFDILVDDRLLQSETLASRWGKDEFVDVVYLLPADMLKGKDRIEVKFTPRPGSIAGGVFHLRLVRPE